MTDVLQSLSCISSRPLPSSLLLQGGGVCGGGSCFVDQISHVLVYMFSFSPRQKSPTFLCFTLFWGGQLSLLAFLVVLFGALLQKKTKQPQHRVFVEKLIAASYRGIRLSRPPSASCDADIPSSSRNRIASPETSALAPSSLHLCSLFVPASLFSLLPGSAMLWWPSYVPPQFVLQVREGDANSEGKVTCGSSLFYRRQPPKMKASRTPLCLISTLFFIKKMFHPLFF